MNSCGPLHKDEQRQNDQLESIYNRSVPMQDIARKISRERRTIETGGEKGSGKSVLAARHDDDDDDENANNLIQDLNSSHCVHFQHQ